MSVVRKKLLKPARLSPGDTLGIAAPAGSFDRQKFEKGRDVLESMGFKVTVPDDVFARKGYLAGADELRAATVNRLFAEDGIDAIICARGGFGSIRVLSQLDFDVIRKNPKIFVGFSDVSALLWTFYSKCGLVTFHGPTVTTLAEATAKTMEALMTAIASDARVRRNSKIGLVIRDGSAEGAVAGGNLTTLCHLLGTPFQPEFKDHILFLEDRGEAAYRIDRMLTQMKMAGCFDGISGVVLGSFEECGKPEDVYKIVNNIFKEYDIPVLAGMDAGHGKENLTLPMGVTAILDTDDHSLSFDATATVV